MKNYFILFSIVLGLFVTNNPLADAQKKSSKKSSFSFVFMTDIHMEYAEKTMTSFNNTVRQVNALRPDFILTGGDNVKDARLQRESYADSLYNLYLQQIRRFTAPVHTGLGNHEVFGVANPAVDAGNAMYGKKMYESKIGSAYSSFTHKGWKFFMLDNIKDVGRRYVGHISAEQMEWLKKELSSTDSSTPIVVVGHIPFISSMKQFEMGSLAPTPDNDGVSNSVEFFRLFEKHNLKLVLQGHFHFFEVLYANDCHYIVSPDPRTGFFLFRIRNEDADWEFIRNE